MKILTSILLIGVAIFMAVIFFPVGVIYSLGSMVWNMCDSATVYLYFYRIALGIDELGNTVMSRLFNDVLIKATGYHFGLDGETISSVLGKNVERGTLTFLGSGLNWILNRIQKNHSILSINNNLNNTE